MSDTRFERDLRAVLDDLAPAEVPDALRDAVTDVPRTAPVRRVAPPTVRSRFVVLGLAAALVVLVAGILAVSGGRFGGVVGGGPTPSASATQGPWTVVTYEVLGSARLMAPTAADIGDVMARVGARLASVGADYRVEATDGGFRVWLRGDNLERLRQLIGTTGMLEFVPLGQTPVQAGQNVDLVANPPLFANDGIASASVDANQTGQRTVDITLTPAATGLFATYTRDHVGDYFAIVLDGEVISAPVIQQTIAGGQVQISQNGIGGYPLADAQNLVAILRWGALPFPVTELENRVVGPNDTPRPPAPSPTLAVTPAATPAPSAPIASLPPLPSPVIPAASSSPAAVTGPWTGLVVEPLAGSPAEVTQAVAWAHGYVGIGPQDATSPTGGWASPDGRTWSPWPEGMFGLSVSTSRSILGVAPCRDGVLALTSATGAVEAHETIDGRAWTNARLVMATGTDPSDATLAGGASGAVVTPTTGAMIFVSSDCSTWTPVTLTGPADTFITGVSTFGTGFVAVGYSGSNANGRTTARAWWSGDGLTWSPAGVTAPQGDGFARSPVAGVDGLAAVMGTPGYTPGLTFLWASRDGRTWSQIPGPMGVSTTGAGVGSVLGTFSGDGARVFAWAAQVGGTSPVEYWTSTGSGRWTRLAITGSGAGAVTDPNGIGQYSPVLLRDGVLFGGGPAWSLGAAAGK